MQVEFTPTLNNTKFHFPLNQYNVNELKDYVCKQVEILTKGDQKPTTRTELLENDFVVW
jgi:hypothetical protein